MHALGREEGRKEGWEEGKKKEARLAMQRRKFEKKRRLVSPSVLYCVRTEGKEKVIFYPNIPREERKEKREGEREREKKNGLARSR